MVSLQQEGAYDMLKKFVMLFCAAVLSCGAAELPERILSGYTGFFLGSGKEGHVSRMIGKLAENRFNSIDLKIMQDLSANRQKMELKKYRHEIAAIYEEAKKNGLILQIYLYPGTAKRQPSWVEHAKCQPVVSAEGAVIEENFAINNIQAWRTMFEHAYSFAELHKEIPFASLKFDIEITPFIYSYDDGTWQRFCAANPQFSAGTAADKRFAALKEKNSEALYRKFFDREVEEAVKTFAAELRAISPDLILGAMPANGSTLMQIMVRNFATDKLPAVFDAWDLYNGGGWEPGILKSAAEVRKIHPGNRYVAWLRPDTYDAEDIAIHAYHTAANLDGYSIWSLHMLDKVRKAVPSGVDPDKCFAAFGKANAAICKDMKEKTLNNPQQIKYKKAKVKVAPIDYAELFIPAVKPVGSGSLTGSVKKYILREQQLILFYASAGENIDITLAHLGGKARPTALQYAIMDQQKNILRNEAVTYDTSSRFTVTAPHTGTFAMVLSAGIGGQAWYSVETSAPYAAVYAPAGKDIYFFSQQKLFIAGGGLGNKNFKFKTTAAESWLCIVDNGKVQLLKRLQEKTIPLPGKTAVEVIFDKASGGWCQNLFINFAAAENPFVFFGPERTFEVQK